MNDNDPKVPTPAPPLRRVPIVGEIGAGDVVTFYDKPREFVEVPTGVVREFFERREC